MKSVPNCPLSLIHIVMWAPLLLSLLPCVLSTPSHTYQGSVLGYEQRCQSLCYTVCDTPDCVSTCTLKFCVAEDTAGLTWLYVGVMMAVVAVLAWVLRLVLLKMVAQRGDGEEEDRTRYYNSL